MIAFLFAFLLGVSGLIPLRTLPAPPPPDPTALAEAERFVAQIPVFEGYFVEQEAVAYISVASDDWLDARYPDLKSSDFRRIFRAKVRLAARQAVPKVWPRVQRQLAESYARRMKPDDLRAATEFFSTPSGHRLAIIVFAENAEITRALSRITRALSREAYIEIAPRFEALVSDALSAEQILLKVNKK